MVADFVQVHPHVFADASFANLEALWANWEKEKKKEKADRGPFEGIPAALPPLLRAYRIHSKAARLGFTWSDADGVQDQLNQEWQEWHAAQVEDGDSAEKALDEYGDYLFTLVEYGRRQGLKANEALDRANRKFLDRFDKLARLAETKGIDLEGLDLDSWNALWSEVKQRHEPSQD